MTHETTGRDVIFRETQRMRQWWLWLIILAGCAAGLAGSLFALYEILGDRPEMRGIAGGEYAAVVVISIVGVAVCIGVPLFLYFARLITEVRPDGLYIQYRPLHLSPRRVPLETAVRIAAVTYDPIGQYSGWGIKWTWKGKAYNASGNRGVRIDYANGRHLLIGSQRHDALAAAIAQIMQPQNAPVQP